METFILATVSLIIATSLIINKNKDEKKITFAFLCANIFVERAASFMVLVSNAGYWKTLEEPALILLPAMSLNFSRTLIKKGNIINRNALIMAFALPLSGYLLQLLGILRGHAYVLVMSAYGAGVALFIYSSLLLYIRKKAAGVEKRRLIYLAIACAIAAGLCLLNLAAAQTLELPPFANILLAALLYFILLIIAYPHLTRLHELMAKALVITISTLLATGCFYLVISLFTKTSTIPLTHILVASFVIVISVTPLKVIMKKIFSFFYPGSQDVFTSLYAFDERLEREKSMMLEEMAPVLAHEIKNPLGSIKGAAQYLATEIDSEENRRILNVIIEETDRLNGVMSQFLTYAKPYKYEKKEQRIEPVLDKIISLVEARKIADSVTIKKEMQEDLPAIKMDSEKIMQVILNLVFNAIEAMPEGGTLTLGAKRFERENSEGIEILVRDTGKGIAKEELKHIFKPFYTSKERGVGLGLAICNRIVRNHGGVIKVKSILGKGSSFRIQLEN
ncbi:MAG: Sensor protein ZraS [Syntrophus sp. PtaB.Bin138]|jgi:signal transduction histidine kinase|uniref:two-component system sensor histidine kinase NtrB n=1 Tax=Syntrophus sp. (in: bacteria) TaxID=48412 RepID=UPI0009CE4672|nr:MAG: Sensor protein ZraS [Syntrophus sp. PtaB.Bin138]